MVVEAGVTVMAVSAGFPGPGLLLTTSEALPEAPLQVAEMAVLPTATPVATPVWVMVATAGDELIQVAAVVTFWVVPLEKLAVALNCWVVCGAMVAAVGLMVMPVTVAPGGVTAFTVSAAVPEVPFNDAVMVAAPALTPVATPPLLMVATEVFEEVQATLLEMSSMVPSEYVPVAVNCCVDPALMVALLGAT